MSKIKAFFGMGSDDQIPDDPLNPQATLNPPEQKEEQPDQNDEQQQLTQLLKSLKDAGYSVEEALEYLQSPDDQQGGGRRMQREMYPPPAPPLSQVTMDRLTIPGHPVDDKDKANWVSRGESIRHYQFTKYVNSDIIRLRKDLLVLDLVKHSQGFSAVDDLAYLTFITDVLAQKSRVDTKGMTERESLVAQIIKQVVSDDQPERPKESKGFISSFMRRGQ